MGLMAGISGHPVSNANKLIGKSTEENKEVLFDRPEYKKADDYISIQVDNPEFQPLHDHNENNNIFPFRYLSTDNIYRTTVHGETHIFFMI